MHKETNQIVLNVTGDEEKGVNSIIQSVDRDMKQVRLGSYHYGYGAFLYEGNGI